MADFNFTPSDMSTFILTGIPGLEDAHSWISIPYATCYIFSLLGNFSILFVVVKEQTLRQPMYLLLCLLALTDISMSTCIVPKALGIFWFNLKVITVNGCLTQITFINMAFATQSGVLVAMGFDRYVAICNPLRYTTILTHTRIAMLGLLSLIRGIVLVLPVTLMLNQLPFCGNRIIFDIACQAIPVAKILCGDLAFYRVYGLVMILTLIGSDLMLIALSYSLIIRAVLRISSQKAHQKALNTCTAHISAMMTSYTSYLFALMKNRFGEGIAPHVHIFLASVFVLVPTMFNPVVYGVKTKELRDKMRKNFCRL
nr:olfactory receptor 52D1-like [Pelodiscus sinensis]|eukprot:XP_006131021.2 olfactory receptor 52D1-like [Pelodiscus sinensis]